jgi:hypothetical protein
MPYGRTVQTLRVSTWEHQATPVGSQLGNTKPPSDGPSRQAHRVHSGHASGLYQTLRVLTRPDQATPAGSHSVTPSRPRTFGHAPGLFKPSFRQLAGLLNPVQAGQYQAQRVIGRLGHDRLVSGPFLECYGDLEESGLILPARREQGTAHRSIAYSARAQATPAGSRLGNTKSPCDAQRIRFTLATPGQYQALRMSTWESQATHAGINLKPITLSVLNQALLEPLFRQLAGLLNPKSVRKPWA